MLRTSGSYGASKPKVLKIVGENLLRPMVRPMQK